MRRSSSRRPSLVSIWLVGLLLLAGSIEVTLHQHREEGAGHTCAVCGAAHASALPILAAAAAAPRLVSSHGVFADASAGPLADFRGVAHSRAPPTS